MRLVTSGAAAFAALALAGCGSGHKSFDKADLPRVVFAKSNAPPGTLYNVDNAGLGFLERERGNAELLRLLRPFGFVADAGSEFAGNQTSIAYAESLAFLFKDPKGASKALAAMHGAIAQVGQGVKDVTAPGLGDESWAVSGVFFPKAPPGCFFVWRKLNLVLAFTMSGSPSVVTESSARSYATKLEGRAGL